MVQRPRAFFLLKDWLDPYFLNLYIPTMFRRYFSK
jgi:hypothetical protein